MESLSKPIQNIYIHIKDINDETDPIVYQIRTDEIFTPYENDSPYLPDPSQVLFHDERPEIEFSIYYATNMSPSQKKIKKPILILDGIDYGNAENERSCKDIYNNALTLIDNPSENLGKKLRNLGYDVVIVNFPTYKIATYTEERIDDPNYWDPYYYGPIYNSGVLDTLNIYRKGGADYIQRNAKGVKKLIKMVNDSLVANNSSEKMIVVGPSMGGQVSRWALKELENEGYNHNTKLWVSFDSPHQGANIPMAMQFAAQYSNQNASLDKLNRPASKQMLNLHYLNTHTFETINFNGVQIPIKIGVNGGAPNFRDRYKNELTTLGYPNPNHNPNGVRKIALVNGTSSGTLNNTPGSEMAYIHLWLASFPWSNVLNGHLYFTNNSGLYKVQDYDFSWISGENDISRYVYTDPNFGSIDASPGSVITMEGSYSLNEYFDNIHKTWFVFDFWIDGYVQQLASKIVFMSTKSTLDFQGNTLLSERICDRDLVQAGETPFDAYYTPVNNEEHVELNTANVNWLLNELNGSYTSPPNLCIPVFDIIGSSTICYYSQQTYHLSSAYFQNVIWDVSNNLQVVSSDNYSITVYLFTYSPGTGIWITASTQDGKFDVASLNFCNLIGTIPFDVGYSDNFNISISLEDKQGEIPLSEQGITNVVWELTSGDGKILEAFDRNAVISGNTFTGRVTVYNENTSATQTFFWPDPNTCKAIFKTGLDEYKVIDRCNNNEIIDVLPIKELYSAYGYKLGDLPLIDQELKIDFGNTGDIQIIKVVIDGESLTKRIIKD